MKTKSILGIVLIAVGALMLAYQGITYTTKDKVVDLGPLEVTKENKETIPLPPVFGVVSLVAGIAIVAVGRKG